MGLWPAVVTEAVWTCPWVYSSRSPCVRSKKELGTRGKAKQKPSGWLWSRRRGSALGCLVVGPLQTQLWEQPSHRPAFSPLPRTWTTWRKGWSSSLPWTPRRWRSAARSGGWSSPSPSLFSCSSPSSPASWSGTSNVSVTDGWWRVGRYPGSASTGKSFVLLRCSRVPSLGPGRL